MKKAFPKKARLTPEVFESLLDDIYSAGEDHWRWPAVLAALASQLSAPGGSLYAGARDAKSFSFAAVDGVNPAALAPYEEYFHSVNPFNEPLSRLRTCAAAPDHHLVAPSILARTEFYTDFARPFDLGGAIYLVMARDDRYEASLCIVRSLKSEPFTGEQVSFVRRLAPHFRRAISLNRRLSELQDGRAGLETALDTMETAVFLLDSTGAICYSNAAGEKVLAKRDGLKVSRGRLRADDQGVQDSLAGLVQKALTVKGARGGSVSVPRRHSARPLLLSIMPISRGSEHWLNNAQSGAILFISDPEARTTDGAGEVMATYGLTPSERKLLSELVAGRTLKEAAEILNIARATSRNRLARIMAKTDTHRQSELIQLILRSCIPSR